MKVVIVGAGEVGYYLAKRLISEDHDLTIIEENSERMSKASETLDAIVIHGNGSSVKTQMEAEVNKADILFAVTGKDDTNILCCSIAKKLGVGKCVARVRNDEFTSEEAIITPERFDIDLMIHPEQSAADEIVRLVERSSALKLVDFADGRLQILGIEIKENSPLKNLTIQEVMQANSQLEFLCLCIYRNEETIIPHGPNYYRSGDVVYFIAPKKNIPELSKMAGYREHEQQNVMIVGGGQLGYLVADQLSMDMNVKLIESDINRAEEISEKLKNTLILHGDGTDLELLVSEQIQEMDCFVAVSGSEKTNLLSGLLARYMGVKRVIIHLNSNEFIPIMSRIGMDAVVSKNIATVNAIMKYTRRGNVVAVSLFEDIDAEAIELIPKPGSPITRQALKDLKLPKEMIVGAIVRESSIIIPHGDTQIDHGDKVVVFFKPNVIGKIESYFS
ncbi:MAG: Trk system potassium transporter TrkA [Candidatus Neomarinimicrobiota bacterium]|nr:MAG: Trk system potassium transporter TrkA [Candidatus Neomarinimicrobiota bacterium]